MIPSPARIAMVWAGCLMVAAVGAHGQLFSRKEKTDSQQQLPSERTVSTSRQFTVFGNDRLQRTKIAQIAERAKSIWLESVRGQDKWRHPIVINILPESEARRRKLPALGLHAFTGPGEEKEGGTFRVQVDIPEKSRPGEIDVLRTMLQAVLLETAYRDVGVPAGGRAVMPPDWLVDGLLAYAKQREDGTQSDAYEALIRSGDVPRLSSLMGERPARMDEVSRQLYEARAAALVRTILENPDGPAELRGFVSGLHNSKPDEASFLAAFPRSIGSAERLSRLWTLTIARQSASSRSESLTARQTRRELSHILSLQADIPGKKNEPPTRVSGDEAYLQLARGQEGRFVLGQRARELMQLSVRAHPLYRPIIQEYGEIFFRLSQGRTRGQEKALASVRELFEALNKNVKEIEAYLDWVEATQPAGTDDEMRRVMQQSEFPEEESPRRNDPITRYLDALEERGW